MLNRILMVWFNKIFRRDQWDQYVERINIQRQNDKWAVDVDVDYPEAAVVLRSLVEMFIKAEAANFFSVEIYDPATFAAYMITVQRKDKYTPAQIIEVYRNALQGIVKDANHDHTHPCYGTQLLWDITSKAENALQRVGFMEKENIDHD